MKMLINVIWRLDESSKSSTVLFVRRQPPQKKKIKVLTNIRSAFAFSYFSVFTMVNLQRPKTNSCCRPVLLWIVSHLLACLVLTCLHCDIYWGRNIGIEAANHFLQFFVCFVDQLRWWDWREKNIKRNSCSLKEVAVLKIWRPILNICRSDMAAINLLKLPLYL